MNYSDKSFDNKVFLVIPAVLGIFLYLNVYLGSFFSGQEYFSLQSILFKIIQLYLYWFISEKIVNLNDKITTSRFLISIVTIATISIVTAASYKQYLIITEPQNDSLSWVHFANYATHGIIVAFAVTLLSMLVTTMKKQQQVLLRNALLEKENIKAQLHALQMQVDPHFLFNNFNTLQSMIDTKNNKAQSYLKNLSGLFRQLLYHRDEQLISLKDDVEIALLFINLLKGRFNEAISIEITLGDIDGFYLPPFTLQILLENVVKHNRIDARHSICCNICQFDEFIVVKNNCHTKRNSYASTGIGLYNLKSRYALLSEKRIGNERMVEDGNDTFKVKVPLLKIGMYD